MNNKPSTLIFLVFYIYIILFNITNSMAAQNKPDSEKHDASDYFFKNIIRIKKMKTYSEYFHARDSLYDTELDVLLKEWNSLSLRERFSKDLEPLKKKWAEKIQKQMKIYFIEMQKYKKKCLSDYFKDQDSLDPIEGFFKEKITMLPFNDIYCDIAIMRSPINENQYIGFEFTSRLDTIADFWGIIEKSSIINIYFAEIDGEEIEFKFDDGIIAYKNNIGSEITLTKMFPLKEKKESKESAREGTGFLLTKSGLIVTNYHVIENSESIDIVFPNSQVVKSAKIEISDNRNDIVILHANHFNLDELSIMDIPYTIANTENIKIGQKVFTLGYPFGSIMGSKPRLSVGIINSLYGLKDDPRMLQISNPLQPGNSGGPLFNMQGELIGIAVSGLNAKFFYDNLGVIPQNVNFAIKISYLKSIINMIPKNLTTSNRYNRLRGNKIEQQIDLLSPLIVKIITH